MSVKPKSKPNSEVEASDGNQAQIIGLMLSLLFFLGLIAFALFHWGKMEYRKTATKMNFSGDTRVSYRGQMDDFESGAPLQKLDQQQRENIKYLDRDLQILSKKSISEMDALFHKKGKM